MDQSGRDLGIFLSTQPKCARQRSGHWDSGRAANYNPLTVTIHAPVTVNANGGTSEANASLAKRMAREIENTMRGGGGR